MLFAIFAVVGAAIVGLLVAGLVAAGLSVLLAGLAMAKDNPQGRSEP